MFRITLKLPKDAPKGAKADTFEVANRPDCVDETAGGRELLRCLVGGRPLRKDMANVAKVEEMDPATKKWRKVKLADLRITNLVNHQVEADKGKARNPGQPDKPAPESADTTPADPAPAKPPEDPPKPSGKGKGKPKPPAK